MKYPLLGNRGRVINSVKNLQRRLTKQHREFEAVNQEELRALWAYGSGPNTLAGDVDL